MPVADENNIENNLTVKSKLEKKPSQQDMDILLNKPGYFERKSERYFNCTDSQRAAFEAGIKLGTVYHQFTGTPISLSNVQVIQRAIEESISTQPFVEECSIKIDSTALGDKKHEFDYTSLTGEILDVKLKIKYKNSIVYAKMKYIPELSYPLMFISAVE